MTLAERLKQSRFRSQGQESMLNVMVTSSWLLGELGAVIGQHGITPAQYNVLRILRGSHPEAMTCSDIGSRLIDRTPDVTRLLNRLQKSGFITRARAEHDRRVVQVHIADKGLDLLQVVDPVVDDAVARLTDALSPDEHQSLSRLLDKLRDSV